VHPGRYCVS